MCILTLLYIKLSLFYHLFVVFTCCFLFSLVTFFLIYLTCVSVCKHECACSCCQLCVFPGLLQVLRQSIHCSVVVSNLKLLEIRCLFVVRR